MALLRSVDRGSIMSKTFGAGSVRHVLKKNSNYVSKRALTPSEPKSKAIPFELP